MSVRCVPADVLRAIQVYFHALIRARAAEHKLDITSVRLPELEPLLELPAGSEQVWFPVPGMYGGFHYWTEADGVDPKLVCESRSRVVGGSGQRHEITSEGAALVAKGFV